MSKPNGFILYEGPSMLDGAPIVVIATGFASKSANSKTGAMVQTWILRRDYLPTDAAHSGADSSVCGECPHRGRIVDGRNVGRTCYVTLFQAPRSVFVAYRNGKYPRATTAVALRALGEGRVLRLGSYGDPAAVPVHVWDAFTWAARGWTGYTHQWRREGADAYQSLCMASCDSDTDRADAKALGWRTFRVSSEGGPGAREISCPASDEAGKRTTCERCRLCAGTTSRATVDVTILLHGAAARRKAA